jgi:hypothetical protein
VRAKKKRSNLDLAQGRIDGNEIDVWKSSQNNEPEIHGIDGPKEFTCGKKMRMFSAK